MDLPESEIAEKAYPTVERRGNAFIDVRTRVGRDVAMKSFEDVKGFGRCKG
jgi:hypothetical protein